MAAQRCDQLWLQNQAQQLLEQQQRGEQVSFSSSSTQCK